MTDTVNFTQYAVIGIGRFGRALTKSLYKLGKDVLAIDESADNIELISDYCTQAVVGDASDEKVLRELDIQSFDVVVVCIGENMQASILTTLLCKQMGVKFVIAKARDACHRTVLEKIGADLVITPEEEAGTKLGEKLVNPHYAEMLELTPNFKIVKSPVPEAWVGKTLQQMDVRKRFGITVLLIKKGEEVVSSPTAEQVFEAGETMIVGGEYIDVDKFLNKLHG